MKRAKRETLATRRRRVLERAACKENTYEVRAPNENRLSVDEDDHFDTARLPVRVLSLASFTSDDGTFLLGATTSRRS